MRTVKKENKFIAKTYQGLEELLTQEIKSTGATQIVPGIKHIIFTGDEEVLYRVNYHCRTAISVFKYLHSFEAVNTNELYQRVNDINWGEYLQPEQRFAVWTTLHSKYFKSSKYCSLKVKDCIADQFRRLYHHSPKFDPDHPEIRIQLYISEKTATLWLDASGEPLTNRGYRSEDIHSEMNEILASAILMFSGWDKESRLVNPMCGNGIIAIEAAMMALNIPPGMYRNHFGFQLWSDYNPRIMRKIINEAQNKRGAFCKIHLFDNNNDTLNIARQNIKNARLTPFLRPAADDFYNFDKISGNDTVAFYPIGHNKTGQPDHDFLSQIGTTLIKNYSASKNWLLLQSNKQISETGLKAGKKYFISGHDSDMVFVNLLPEVKKTQNTSFTIEKLNPKKLKHKEHY